MAGLSTQAQAGFWSTSCAGREIGDAYQNAKAVALVKAAAHGRAEEVAALARDHPGLVNTLEDGAVPPLLWAICADSLAGFEALLKAGANPNLGGNGHGRGNGGGPSRRERGSIISEGWSAMLMAASREQPEYLKLALQYGGDLNAEKGIRDPNRPLLMAAYHGHFDNVKMLIAAGADINTHDRLSSATDYAIAVTGRFDIAVWLLEHGYSHDLQRLASGAEIRQVPLADEQQGWKEKLIGMLRARGMVFPASPGIRRAIAIERDIPPQDIDDIVLGRKNIFEYPKKPAKPVDWSRVPEVKP